MICLDFDWQIDEFIYYVYFTLTSGHLSISYILVLPVFARVYSFFQLKSVQSRFIGTSNSAPQ